MQQRESAEPTSSDDMQDSDNHLGGGGHFEPEENFDDEGMDFGGGFDPEPFVEDGADLKPSQLPQTICKIATIISVEEGTLNLRKILTTKVWISAAVLILSHLLKMVLILTMEAQPEVSLNPTWTASMQQQDKSSTQRMTLMVCLPFLVNIQSICTL
jgi:hypothetical protein